MNTDSFSARAHRGPALALCLLAAAGCTGSVELEAAPLELADAYCDAVDRCAGRLAPLSARLPSDCRGAMEGTFASATGAYAALVERGTVEYDADAARDCVEALRDIPCADLDGGLPRVCRSAVLGRVPLGGACSTGEECAGDATCAGATCPFEAGTCVARSGEGEPCSDDDACAGELVCAGGRCGAPPGEGPRPCGGPLGERCAIGETCVGDTDEAPGVCTQTSSYQTAALGERCGLIGEPTLCVPSARCALSAEGPEQEYACVAPVALGALCTFAIPSMCPPDSYCRVEPDSGDRLGLCARLPQAGEACASVPFGPVCAGTARCGLEGCVQPQLDGAACASHEDCYGRCVDGVCAGPALCPPTAG